MTITRQ
jgi:hypothetical protein